MARQDGPPCTRGWCSRPGSGSNLAQADRFTMDVSTLGVYCHPYTTTEDTMAITTGTPDSDSIETTYAGAVLDVFEMNGYDDSDFCAAVWDGENVRTVTYASTRYWTYRNNAEVDATEDVIAAATEWYRALYITFAVLDAEEEAEVPSKGRTVRSLTTRGKNKGLVGEVRWYGEDSYAPRYAGITTVPMRVAVKVDGEDKLRYLPADRVEVIDPEPVALTGIIARAMVARPHNWRSANIGVVRAMR